MTDVGGVRGGVKIKICGVTRAIDAEAAVRAGADFLGLNVWAHSKRRVSLADAAELARVARGAGPIAIVGVFVDPTLDEVRAAIDAAALDVVQLHGDETPAFAASLAGVRVWKAIAIPDSARVDLATWPAHTLLLDAATPGRGGSGRTIDWAEAARIARAREVVLAGGLTPDNVAAAVRAVRPWAIDVASGVESSPGIKDVTKIAAFAEAARVAARAMAGVA